MNLEIFDEYSTLNTQGNEIQSQSWDNNPDVSLIPYDQTVKLGES